MGQETSEEFLVWTNFLMNDCPYFYFGGMDSERFVV